MSGPYIGPYLVMITTLRTGCLIGRHTVLKDWVAFVYGPVRPIEGVGPAVSPDTLGFDP
jgi:hypothetical protein